MPEITTTITENKKNIIIKTKKNNMWIFRSNKEMVIEKSIFRNGFLKLIKKRWAKIDQTWTKHLSIIVGQSINTSSPIHEN